MERSSHVDRALCALWLRGFPVPAAKLRRAWQHCNRLRKPWLPMPELPERDTRRASKDTTLLGEITHTLGQALPPDQRVAGIIEHALARVSRAGRPDGTAGSHLWSLLQMAGLALDSSALLATADDALLTKAQHYLGVAAALLEASSGEADAWNNWLADRLGPPLVLVIMAMLWTGQAGKLDALVAQVQALGRRRAPAQAPLHRVMA